MLRLIGNDGVKIVGSFFLDLDNFLRFGFFRYFSNGFLVDGYQTIGFFFALGCRFIIAIGMAVGRTVHARRLTQTLLAGFFQSLAETFQRLIFLGSIAVWSFVGKVIIPGLLLSHLLLQLTQLLHGFLCLSAALVHGRHLGIGIL